MCVLYACISQTFEPGGQVHQPGPFLDQATGGPNGCRGFLMGGSSTYIRRDIYWIFDGFFWWIDSPKIGIEWDTFTNIHSV